MPVPRERHLNVPSGISATMPASGTHSRTPFGRISGLRFEGKRANWSSTACAIASECERL